MIEAKTKEEWEAPSYNVAVRWRDEWIARGYGSANIECRYSGTESKWIVEVWRKTLERDDRQPNQ